MLLSNKLCLGFLIALTAFVRAATVTPDECYLGQLAK
jgi:hypothetical protein